MKTSRILTALGAMIVIATSCSRKEARSGVLAALADSALPERVPTQCSELTEGPIPADAAPNIACQARLADTTVTIVQPPRGTRVLRVTRVWKPAGSLTAAYDSAVSALSAKFGAGQRICTGSQLDPAHRWQRDSFVVTLYQDKPSMELDLTFKVDQPAFAQSCDPILEPTTKLR